MKDKWVVILALCGLVSSFVFLLTWDGWALITTATFLGGIAAINWWTKHTP